MKPQPLVVALDRKAINTSHYSDRFPMHQNSWPNDSAFNRHVFRLSMLNATLLVVLGLLCLPQSIYAGDAKPISQPNEDTASKARSWFGRAVAFSEKIDAKATRAEASAILAGAAADIGNSGAYQRMNGRAIALTWDQPTPIRGSVMWSLAIAYAKAGHEAKALVTAEACPRPYFVICANSDLVGVFMARGDQSTSQRALKTALQAYEQAQKPHTKQAGLFKLAEALALCGRYEKVVKLAEASTSNARGAEALAHAAAIASNAGQQKRAEGLLAKARDHLGQSQNTQLLAQAQAALVEALVCLGKSKEAVKRAKTLSDSPESAGLAWSAIAADGAKAGNKEKAQQAWHHARYQVKSIDRAYRRAWLWQHLVTVGIQANLIKDPQALVNSLPTVFERTLAALAFAHP